MRKFRVERKSNVLRLSTQRLSLESLESRWMLDASVSFNEVMYNPGGANESLEWVELYNQLGVNVDLSGWRIDNGIDYTFPAGTVIPGRGFIVVAADPAALQAATGFATAIGPFGSADRLSNGGEEIQLKDVSGRVVDALDYGDNDPWPVGADGSGSTLAKRIGISASDVAENWATSAQLGGTPGAINFPSLAEQLPVTSTVLSDANAWRYNDTGTDLQTAWRAPAYNDASWAQSAGPFQAGEIGGGGTSPLVGYWTFDNDVLDHSASGVNDGTLVGATYDANVPPAIGSGKSLSFTGTTTSPGANPISVPGLVLWLDAGASHVTKDASNRVTAWNDATGATNNTAAENVTQANTTRQPLWVANGINNQPVIRFDGVDDRLDNTINNLVSPAVDRTIIIVGDGNNAGSGGTPFTLRQTAPVFAAQLALTNGTMYAYTDAAVRNITTANILSTIQQPFLSVHRTSGTTLSLDVNGTTRTLSGNPIANWEGGGTGFTVGARNDQSATVNGPNWQIYSGDIAEVLVFNRNLTTTELADVSTYLNQKYALPSSAPANSSRVEIPANASLNSSSFTLAYWMQDPGQTTGVGTSAAHLGHNRLTSRGSNSFETAVSNTVATGGNSSIKFYSQSAWTETTQTTTPGAWTHVAYVSDGSTMRVYANGVEVFSGPSALAPSGPMVIGASASGGEGFVGRIDDVALWSAPLSAATIQSLAAGTISPPAVVVPAAPPVTPSDIAGLSLWLDAEAGHVTKDGTNHVSSWNDITGATNNTTAQNVAQPTAARQPTWVASALGGRPAIRFDGVDDLLDNLTDNLLTPGADRTIIVVGDGANQGGTLLTLRRTALVFAAQLAGPDTFVYTDAQAVNITGANILPTIVDPFVSVHRAAGNTLTVEINGEQRASGTLQNAEGGAAGFTVGGRDDQAATGLGPNFQIWNGDISEVLVFNRALTATELTSLRTYLERKYRLNGAVPIGKEVALGPTTHYFRSTFNFSDDPARTSLTLIPWADDGAVYYLNGVEVYRQNMPSGAVTYNTLAASTIGIPSAGAAVTIPTTNLVTGQNVLAVEIHQASPSSEDMFFSATLSATVTPPPPGAAIPLQLNEVAAATAPAGQFRVELTNIAATSFNVGGYVIADSAAHPIYTIPAGSLAGGAQLVITESQLGYRPADGDRLFLLNPAKNGVIDAVAVSDRLRGRSTQYDGRWLFPNAATFGAPNTFSFENNIVINEIMYHARPVAATPAIPPTYTTSNLVVIDAATQWRYNQSNTDLGQNWQNTTYTASTPGWQEGPALLAFETSTLVEPIRTQLLNPSTAGQFRQTIYFQTTFNVANLAAIDTLLLRHIIDDGAVFYLNGTEIYRTSNLPATGPVSFSTAASTSVDNAGYVGPITIPKTALVQGVNRLSVEVHQIAAPSSDITFGAELLAAVQTAPGVPGTPFQESPEQWIELYNRGATPVDLSGWDFGDGIDYDFPAGTIIAPGQYRVVAWDPAAMATLHPGVAALGPFSGSLSGGGERIQLRDANRNPADEVRYYDAGYWPEYADGAGSSLELRDPDSDNNKGQAWAASDETDAGAWQTITYRGTTQASSVGPDGVWQEFQLGLLDAGEFLLDDVRVVQTPSTTPVNVIQNGTFQSDAFGAAPATWRVGGTHGSHGRTVVEADPDNGSNHVLHVVATGPMDDMFNHLETTLKNNGVIAPINNGVEYEISFRIKWLAGDNQVNSRLFFNRLPRTTVFNAPVTGGTPGAANSRFATNVGPTYSSMSHSPVVPAAGAPVTVTVQAADNDGVASMTLFYRAGTGAWQNAPMALSAGRYAGTIPGQAAGTVVQFYVQGVDGLGATSTYPAAGVNSRALYQVEDGRAQNLAQMHNVRVVMTPTDADFLHAPTNALSNDRIGGTVIYDESTVYYDVGVRLKGSERGRRQDVRISIQIEFRPEQLFAGVYDKMSVDRSGAGDELSQKEIIVKHVFDHAGDLAGQENDLIRAIMPRNANTSTAIFAPTRYGDEFLRTYTDNGDDGTLFELELIYYPTGTTDGNPESPKLAYPGSDNVWRYTLGNVGNDEEQYRWQFLIKNNRDADDYEEIVAFAKAFSLSGTPYLDALTSLADVDEMLRVYAVANLVGVADAYVTGDQHNTAFYVRPDGKVEMLPWDWDFSFVGGATAGLEKNADLSKLLAKPEFRHNYYGHLHDIISTTFNSAYMTTWVNHYDSFVPESFAGYLQFINDRSNSVLSQLNTAAPSVPFNITTPATPTATVNSTVATIAGTGWINVREIHLAGDPTPLPITWTATTGWQVTVPVAFGPHTVTLEAYNFQGALIATDSVVIDSTVSDRPLQDFLRVSELMYHPLDPSPAEISAGDTDADNFEFVELINTSSTVTLDLTTAHFSQGITYDFADGAVTSLAPGQRLVLVENAEAFAARYPGVSIGGQYSGKLDNAGETLSLTLDDGSVIQSFTYDDTGAGWHPSTDGLGYSLVIINPLGATATWNDGASWKPSAAIGGSPGRDDLIEGDVNGDGLVSLADLAIVQSHLGTASGATRADGDLNGDGAVNRTDARILAQNFGRTSGAGSPSAPAAVIQAVSRASRATLVAQARRVIRVDEPVAETALTNTLSATRRLARSASSGAVTSAEQLQATDAAIDSLASGRLRRSR